MELYIPYIFSFINSRLYLQESSDMFFPCIHCILTSKQEALYTALLTNIRELLPQLLPTHGMSDWEIGPRNAFKKVFQGIHLHGCYFHYAQNVRRKLRKLTIYYLSSGSFIHLIRILA